MSSPSSYTYETIYVLRSGISDSDASTIHQKVDTVISKFQGKLISRDDWGNKEMAYMIDKETNGKYSVIVYNGKGGVVEEIERHFRISDDVIRYLTVSVASDYDYGKAKKQLQASEEEVRKNREMREQRKRAAQEARG
jgi:small subunit ribosomal protein S6